LVSLLASEITTTTTSLVEEGEDRLMTALTLVCLVCLETTTTMDVTVVEGGGEMLLALMRLVSGSLVWKAFSVVVEVTVAVTVVDSIKDSPNGMVGAKEDPTRVGTKEDPTRDGTKEDSLRAVANAIIS